MPSSEKKPKGGGNLLDEIEIRDMASVRQYSSGGAGGVPGAALSPGTGVKIGGQNIVTVEMPKEQLVQQFEPGKIHDSRGVHYSSVVRGIPDAVARANSRFRINELTRGPLSVEAEEEARIEAEVQRRLAERLDQMRAQVTESAHSEGFAAGSAEAQQTILAEFQPRIAQFNALMASLESMRSEIFKANEELLLRMVNQLTRAIVLHELKNDADYTRRLATHLIERVGTRENIRVYVSEAELTAAATLREGLAQTLGELKNISIEGDPAIKAGGCRIETEFGEVDGRIETQLQSIASGLGTDQKELPGG